MQANAFRFDGWNFSGRRRAGSKKIRNSRQSKKQDYCSTTPALLANKGVTADHVIVARNYLLSFLVRNAPIDGSNQLCIGKTRVP
jgi:hypothetical protein